MTRRVGSTALAAVIGLGLSVLAAVTTGTATAGAVTAGPGEYVAVAPARILDTRASGQPIAGLGSLDLDVSGAGGLPPADEVSSVVLTVTAVDEAAAGWISVYPANTTPPATSVSNFAAGETRAHTVAVAPGANGSVTIHNGAPGAIDVVVDVQGWYTAGTPTDAGQFGLVPQARLLDTRTTVGGHHGQLTSAGYTLPVAGHGGVPSTAAAVLLNVTATRATSAGWVGVQTRGTSTVNVAKTRAASNLAVVPLSADGSVLISDNIGGNYHGSVDVVIDVFGYYLGGAPYAAGRLGTLSADRLLDTRESSLTAVPAGGTATVPVGGTHGIPSNATAATLNLTVASPVGSGYLSMYPSGTSRPGTSTLNFAGRTVANSVFATLGDDGAVTVYNGSAHPQDIVVDVTAYVGHVPGPYRWTASRTLLTPTSDEHRRLVGVSCPTADFCALVGNTSATASRVWFYRSGTWSAGATLAAGSGVTGVSCVSATHCVAMADDRSFTWTGGTTWTAALLPDPGGIPLDTRGISCPSTTFCMASGGRGDQPYTWRFDGTTWTESNPGLTGEDGRPSVSCASATSCVAVGAEEGWVTAVWNGTAWHAGPTVGTDFDVDDISCPAGTTTCTAVGPSAARSFDGTTWTSQARPAGTSPVALDCTGAQSCVGLDRDGGVTFGDGTSWTSAATLGPDATFSGLHGGVSCAGGALCVVLSDTDARMGVPAP